MRRFSTPTNWLLLRGQRTWFECSVRRFSGSTTAGLENAIPKGSTTKDPQFVTTPIFYVNGGGLFPALRLSADPHIGHMHSMIVADVVRRYLSLQGNDTLFTTGTDEHGIKVVF